MDLLEGLRCSALPLLCEHIIEVSFRNWLVAPALQKDGGYCVRKAPILHEDQRDETSDETDKGDFKVTPAHLFMFLSTPFSWKFCWLYFRRDDISGEAPSLREYSLHCQTSSWTNEPHRSDITRSCPSGRVSISCYKWILMIMFSIFSIPGETEEVCAVAVLTVRNIW